MAKTHPFAGARKAKPTQKHRPAIWEGILGAVYAMNDANQVQYFGHDWDGAREFAGVTEDRDLRLHRKNERVSYTGLGDDREPRQGQWVLWVTREGR